MLGFIVIFVCLLFNALLACAEVAFISVKKGNAKKLAEEGDKRAQLLIELKGYPARVLSLIQVGVTFVAMLAAAFGGSGAEREIVPWLIKHFSMQMGFATVLSVFLVVIPLSLVNVIIAELVPKMLALQSPLFFALRTIRLLHVASSILYPVVRGLELVTELLVKVFSKVFRSKTSQTVPSSIELEELHPRSRQYVMNILHLEHLALEKSLISWDKVIFIHKEASLEDVEKVALESRHTRLPVLKGEEVVGILHTKEFFAWRKQPSDKNWTSLLHPVKGFEKKTPSIQAFLQMQKEKRHMAIVYDHGHKVGIITIEDILEEVVGEIYDEDDPKQLFESN